MRRECGGSDGRERVRRSGAGGAGARIHHLPGKTGAEPAVAVGAGLDGAVAERAATARVATVRTEVDDRVDYMADMIAQLEAMARQAGQPMLARLLALAHEEASRAVAGLVRGDTRR